ncbi:thioredoxin peroxidase dot5 [Cryptotrichosporon argae]
MARSSAPPSRSSARLAGKPAPTSSLDEKKRAASPAKKAAVKSSAKAASKTKKDSAGKKETTSKKEAASKKGASKKAPLSAAQEAESEAEADASAQPSTDGAGPELDLGDVLPSIALENEQGEAVDVGALAAERGVVVFVYPRADTPGCTTQACGFRDAYDDIQAEGYDVYGLSLDKPNAQKNWSTKHKLSYHLLCDPDQVFIKRLGAFVPPKNTKRSHFIFEKGTGKLIDAEFGVKPALE